VSENHHANALEITLLAINLSAISQFRHTISDHDQTSRTWLTLESRQFGAPFYLIQAIGLTQAFL